MIGSVTWCIIYSTCLLAGGYGTIALIELVCRNKPDAHSISKIERFGQAACLGPGAVGMILIAASMVGQPPSKDLILALAMVGAVLAIAGAIARRDKLPPLPRLPRIPAWLAAICLLIVGYGVVTVALDALLYPSYEWDAFSVWQLKAKVLSLYPMLPRPGFFNRAAFSYSVQRYPLLIPMISAGVHAMTGDLSDELGQSPYFLMYIGLAAAMFGYLRRARNPSIALFVTAVFMTVPALLACAAAGTADFPLTAFYGCSVLALLRWNQFKRAEDFVLAILFSAFMTWTKNEGSALAAINLIVLFLFSPSPLKKQNLLTNLSFAVVVAIIAAPRWFYIRGLPITTVDYLTQIRPAQLLANLNRLPSIFAALLMRGPWMWRDFGLLAPLLVAAVLIDHTEFFAPPRSMLWALLALHILAYFPPYLVTQLSLPDLFPVTVPRLLVHVTPVAALLIGWHWPAPSSKLN